jgi:hypothetical protein
LVEEVRSAAIHGILAALKKRTGKDFGDDPLKWIQQFDAKQIRSIPPQVPQLQPLTNAKTSAKGKP